MFWKKRSKPNTHTFFNMIEDKYDGKVYGPYVFEWFGFIDDFDEEDIYKSAEILHYEDRHWAPPRRKRKSEIASNWIFKFLSFSWTFLYWTFITVGVVTFGLLGMVWNVFTGWMSMNAKQTERITLLNELRRRY
jgi:hypothetical protein